MDLRCKNCHAHLSVPSVGPVKEVQCPKCGATMLLPRPGEPAAQVPEDAVLRKKHKHAMQRVFDPIPTPVLYIAGIVFALLLLSPFWAYMITDFQKKPVLFTDDAGQLPAPTNAAPRSEAWMSTNATAGANLSQYAGIRLDVRRSELDHRFNLSLQNTRGMQPEIFTAQPAGDIEQFVGHFYDGILKEFTLIMRDRLLERAAVEKSLIEQFGPPTEQNDVDNGPPVTGLVTLGLPSQTKDTEFARRRVLTWMDAEYRVDATLSFNEGESPQALTKLQIRLSAATWLKINRPIVGSTAPPPAATVPALPDRPAVPHLTPNGKISP